MNIENTSNINKSERDGHHHDLSNEHAHSKDNDESHIPESSHSCHHESEEHDEITHSAEKDK